MSQAPNAIRLPVKVVPGASKTEVAGWLGDALKIRVARPAEKGQANREVEALVCRLLSLPAGSVSIVRGGTSARKLLEIKGVSAAEIRLRFGGRAPGYRSGEPR